MIANKRVPKTSTSLLTKLIRLKKKNIFFIDDEWKPIGSNRRRGIALAMVPVPMDTSNYTNVAYYN